MSTDNRFDEPALNVAQKIMECRATAAEDGWPDVRLKAAIQCLVIEAMKWSAPAAPDAVQVDAARWRALVGSARIRILGTAGFTPATNPGIDGPSNPDFRHFGAELWTHHAGWPSDKNQLGIDTLTQYADQMRKLLGDSPATPGAWSDVVAERQRQIEKGYTAEHDDEHVCDEIAAMAAYYIMPEACRDWPTEETGYGDTLGKAIIPEGWPAPESPRWRRDDLIRGIAMAVAEVERLDRAENAPGGEDA